MIEFLYKAMTLGNKLYILVSIDSIGTLALFAYAFLKNKKHFQSHEYGFRMINRFGCLFVKE